MSVLLRVLVPVDGSDPSLAALHRLLGLQDDWFRARPELHLLNVQLPVASGAVRSFVGKEQLHSYYHDEGIKSLQVARQTLDESGHPHRFHIAVGDPACVIVDYANQEACGLIVMGTRGLGSLQGMVLGSVATKVGHLASIPVLFLK